jgi:hypothetical protein
MFISIRIGKDLLRHGSINQLERLEDKLAGKLRLPESSQDPSRT